MKENAVNIIDYTNAINKLIDSDIDIKNNLDILNNNLEDLIFTYKEEIKKIDNEKKEIEKEKEKELKLLPQKQKEEQKIQEQQKEKEDKFLKNIESLVNNSDSKVVQDNQQLLIESINNTNTLIQVNILCMGLVFGVICISLFAKFFKK